MDRTFTVRKGVGVLACSRHRNGAVHEEMTELVAGSEPIAAVATPSAFVHVFTQCETICSANDSTFVFAHRFFFANVDVEALEDGAQSELKDVHDWKIDQVILGKYRADLLCAGAGYCAKLPRGESLPPQRGGCSSS
jgi:hypothetical protein